jgi:hypothetical protein
MTPRDRSLRVKLGALADPLRNDNQHERAVAQSKLAGLPEERPASGLLVLPASVLRDFTAAGLRDFSRHIRQQKRAADLAAARHLRDADDRNWQQTHVAEEAAAIDLENLPERKVAMHAAFDEELAKARRQQRRGVKPTDPYVIADRDEALGSDWITRTVEPPKKRPYVLADDAREEWAAKTFGPACNEAGPDCVARFGPHSPTCRSRTLRSGLTAATVVPPGENGKRTL